MEVIIQTDSASDAVKQINAARLDNKGKWIFIYVSFLGESIKIKSFNTWIQVFQYNGMRCSNGMDSPVGEYRSFLLNKFETIAGTYA